MCDYRNQNDTNNFENRSGYRTENMVSLNHYWMLGFTFLSDLTSKLDQLYAVIMSSNITSQKEYATDKIQL